MMEEVSKLQTKLIRRVAVKEPELLVLFDFEGFIYDEDSECYRLVFSKKEDRDSNENGYYGIQYHWIYSYELEES